MAFTASNTAVCVIAAKRAWANGFWPPIVVNIIAFQSKTTSAFAVAEVIQSTITTLSVILRRVRFIRHLLLI
jgi:hypothetical protein